MRIWRLYILIAKSKYKLISLIRSLSLDLVPFVSFSLSVSCHKEEERGNKRGEEKRRNELAPTLRQPYAPKEERGER